MRVSQNYSQFANAIFYVPFQTNKFISYFTAQIWLFSLISKSAILFLQYYVIINKFVALH